MRALTLACLSAQVTFPVRAVDQAEAYAYKVLKDMVKRCLCHDAQQRVKAFVMSEKLHKAAKKAGWLE